MRATSKLLALAFTAALQPAMAGVKFLNFEDFPQTFPQTDPLPVQLGAYDGVTFNGGAWGVTSSAAPCKGFNNFVRAGSCGALELAQDATSAPVAGTQAFILDLAGGFINEFSFVYSARGDAGVKIQLFDGTDGNGNVLGTLSNLNGTNCTTGYRFCDWSQSNIKFSGVALSLKVSGFDQSLLLDDLQFTTPSPSGGNVPEPASIALAAGALGAAAWTRRRAAR